jgi:protoporphyrinogen oxidase
MPEVVIVGAGIAGLSAALRLIERGFDVTIFEEDAFIGGKLGAHSHPDRPNDYHEHSYHMYLNWYHNFWQMIDEIGVSRHFVPQQYVSYIPHGRPHQVIKQTNVASPWHSWENAFAGLKPPATMFLYLYSMVDLLSTPMHPRGDFDRWSVHGFLTSRGYMTEEATKLHGLTLVRAFSCPTFLSDARTYKHFESYSVSQPDPMMWLLKGNSQQFLFSHFEEHLKKRVREGQERGTGAALRICLLSRIEKMHLENRVITGLEVAELAASPTIDLGGHVQVKARHYEPVNGDVVMAIPPKALAELIDVDVYSADPWLSNIKRLDSLPMASFDVYFKRKLPNIPKGVVILLDSKHELSFLDTSQLWPQDPANDVTSLNVVLSDFRIFSGWHQEREIAALKSYVFQDLKNYIEFNYDDIDCDRCHFQTNAAEELFINEVGSWDFRPLTTGEILNLFIAGDYCRTPIDVVTVESAVVSGLVAAEVIRRQRGLGDPIRILKPKAYPEAIMAGFKFFGMPLAYAAKATSGFYDAFRSKYNEVFPDH